MTFNEARDYEAGMNFMRGYVKSYGTDAAFAWVRGFNKGHVTMLPAQRVAGMLDALLAWVQA